MGGNAFSNRDPPLIAPRLTPRLFRHLCELYISQLFQIYERVVSPTPAPDKATHGDIDILVAGPKPWGMAEIISGIKPRPAQHLSNPSQRPSNNHFQHLPKRTQAAAILLHAVDVISNGPDQPANFAAPHPEAPSAVVQVDVRVCATDAALDRLLLLETHGDFWLIAGRALKHIGLGINDKGLWLRDAGIEREAWAAARFPLTDDPGAVLDFLGLDAETFWRPDGFASREAMFAFLGGMRFFSVAAFEDENGETQPNGKERKRREQRPLYRQFCEDWIPQHAAALAAGETPARAEISRDEARETALAWFGRGAEWEQWRTAWWEEFWRSLIQAAVKKQQREERRQEVAYVDAWISVLDS